MSSCPVHRGAGFCACKVAPQQRAWVPSKPVDAPDMFPTCSPADARCWSWQSEDGTFPRFCKITSFSNCIRITGAQLSARSQPLCIPSNCKWHLKTILLFDPVTACSAPSSVRRVTTAPLVSTGLANPRAKKPKSYQHSCASVWFLQLKDLFLSKFPLGHLPRFLCYLKSRRKKNAVTDQKLSVRTMGIATSLEISQDSSS